MKRILVTGATSGIGLALTQLCATRGYYVIACGRNQQVLDTLSGHKNIETLRFDVTDELAVKQALTGIKCDIAVLNAGVCEYVDTEAFEPNMFERVFAANFFGIVNCIEPLLHSMSKGNQLVMVDSLARLLPFTRSQAYGASKAALHYLTKSLEVDLAHKGIIVQSASPGFIETPLTDKNDFEMPMKISAAQAVEALLTGIEKQQKSIYFPRLFSLILLMLSRLPARMKVSISKRIKQGQ